MEDLPTTKKETYSSQFKHISIVLLESKNYIHSRVIITVNKQAELQVTILFLRFFFFKILVETVRERKFFIFYSPLFNGFNLHKSYLK